MPAQKGVFNSGSPMIGGSLRIADSPSSVDALLVEIIQGTDINAPDNSIVRTATVNVIFRWNKVVNGFTVGDVALAFYDAADKAGSIASFFGADGNSLFSAVINLPAASSGELDIIIPAGAATWAVDANVTGPATEVRKTIRYNTIASTITHPTVRLITREQTWRNVLFPVELRWSENVSGFSLSDISVNVGSLSDFREIDEDFYTALWTLPSNSSGNATLTVAADSAQGHNGKGPHPDDYTATFAYDTAQNSTAITPSTTIHEETHDFADNPYLDGAFCNVLELIEHNSFIYLVVQIIHNRGITPVDFLAWDYRAGAVFLRIPTTGGSVDILGTYDDVMTAPRSLKVYQNAVHFFRGSHYAYQDNDVLRRGNTDWKQEIGGLYKLNGTTTELVARFGELPEIVENETRQFGGMVSPLVVNDSKLYALAGYGDLREIGKNLIADKDVDDIENWNLGRITEVLETRLPILNTNDKTGWELLREIAIATNSRIGFDGNRFVLEPITALSAKVKTAITSASTSLEAKDFSHLVGYETSGFILVGDELIEYSGLSSGTLTGLTRAVEDTTAAAHAVNADIYFVDHVILDTDKINVSNDPERIYNVIRIRYGNNSKEAIKSDSSSITKYGRQELDLSLPLGNDQEVWADHIADVYLNRLKDGHAVVSLDIDTAEDVKTFQNIYVRQKDRAHLSGVGKVLEVGHTLSTQSTNIVLEML